MKKYINTLFIGLVCTGFTFAQSSEIMFLDMSGIDGEYTTPTRTKFTGQNPKSQNLLLTRYSYDWAAETSFDRGAGVAVGKPNSIGEMTLNFQIDKSVISLFNRLLNNTIIPEMDIFIDKPANVGNSTLQTELSRIKMYNVTIRDLVISNTEIPQYSMRIRFDRVAMIINTFDGVGVGTKGTPYCFNYLTQNSSNCFTF